MFCIVVRIPLRSFARFGLTRADFITNIFFCMYSQLVTLSFQQRWFGLSRTFNLDFSEQLRIACACKWNSFLRPGDSLLDRVNSLLKIEVSGSFSFVDRGTGVSFLFDEQISRCRRVIHVNLVQTVYMQVSIQILRFSFLLNAQSMEFW